MAVTASIVVDYGGLEDVHISAELDNTKNDGKSSFNIGDTVWFRIYHDVDYDIEATSGILSTPTLQSGAIESPELVSFVRSPLASVQRPIKGGLSIDWYGSRTNNIVATGTDTIKVIGGSDTMIGVGLVTYNTEWDLYSLTFPSGVTTSEYAILVVATAKAS